MANHPSAEKRNRQRIKRTIRNRAVSSTVRTLVKNVRTALHAKDAAAAATALKIATVAPRQGRHEGCPSSEGRFPHDFAPLRADPQARRRQVGRSSPLGRRYAARGVVVTDPDENRDRAHAAREALVGKTIAGRYILRGLLGHGGMGAVYEAEHVGLGKRAAIKFVDPEFATDEKVVARFAREARAMSAIESAHIVTVFDAGTEDGRPYLVMELLRGEDLGQRLRRLTRVPLGEAMHIIAQVLKGLARAHAAGIVHRDLKPDNVFLVKHDTDPLFAKIVDFGISKIERPARYDEPARAHRTRHRARDAVLHVARTGAGIARRRPSHRSLQRRRDPLRVPHRATAAHRRELRAGHPLDLHARCAQK